MTNSESCRNKEGEFRQKNVAEYNGLIDRKKGEKENQDAFVQHFTQQLELYKRVAIVNLVDQVGKEKIMADTFLHHVVAYNCPDLAYVAFDFHEYCRGMKFENVSILIENIKDIIKDMRYCWSDDKGVICTQRGVFRVNCIDCLDRTNIVQSAIARVILETQCRKLGLLAPDEQLPPKSRLMYQQMWANNGDTISRQYAGTAALKGDYTRTGERKLTGMMKDGVNSANRYYLNRFKDAYRQATIDLMLGYAVSVDLSSLAVKGNEAEDDSVLVEKEENMKTLIDECKKMLITEPEDCLGGWGLIDCDPVTGDPTQQDMDIILLLSQRAYYVANYDDETDQVTSYQKVFLEDLERIEIGPAPALFKSKHICIRIYYTHDTENNYFHSFRTTSTRLFNNMIIEIRNEEDAKESLRAICEAFTAAQKLLGLDLSVVEGKLDRKRTKPHPTVIDITQAQMHTFARTTNPAIISHESSSNDLKASVARRRLDITKLGRTFAGLNPIRKVRGLNARLRAPRIPGFLPAVLYSKNSDVDTESNKVNSLERAKILKGDHIPEVAEDGVDNPHELPREYSFDDMDAVIVSDYSGQNFQFDAEEGDGEVLLESCGILATKPSRVIKSLLEERRASAAAELEAKRRSKTISVHQTSSEKQQKKDKLVNSKWKSLDIDDKAAERESLVTKFDIKEIKRALSPQPEQDTGDETLLVGPSSGLSSIIEMPSSGALEKICEGGQDDDHKVKMAVISGADNNESQQSMNGNQENGENDEVKFEVGGEEPRNLEGISNPAFSESVDEQEHTQGIEDDTKSQEETEHGTIDNNIQYMSESSVDTWVNLNVDFGDMAAKNMMLYHPAMKMSFSDGSLSYHQADFEDLSIDASELKAAESGLVVSPFSKLRVKMATLALPTMPSPQTKRRQAEEMAEENKRKSEEKFRECKSQIVLL